MATRKPITPATPDPRLTPKPREVVQFGRDAGRSKWTPPAESLAKAAKYTNEPGMTMEQLQSGLLDAQAITDPAVQAYLAGLSQPQANPLDEFLSQFGSDTSGGGGSGYNLQGELGNIAQTYQTMLDNLIGQRDRGATAIDESAKTASTEIGARATDNASEAQRLNQQVIASYSQALQQSRDEASKLSAELERMGITPNKLAPATAQAQGYLGQAQAAQTALGDRMQQIASQALSGRQANSALVAQGAQGQLTNNYSAMKSQLDLQRQQQEAQAQAAARAAAASASKGSDPLTQATKYLNLQKLYNDVNGIGGQSAADYLKENGQFDTSMLEPGTGAFAAASSGASNYDSVLRDYYKINGIQQPVTDAQGNPITDASGQPEYTSYFDQQAYDNAVAQLAAARSSQQQKAKTGYSFGDTAKITRAKKVLGSMYFKGN